MSWFLAKIVFRIVCGDGDHTAQFDEQLRLIEAADETEAYSKAVVLGHGGEDHFLNQSGELVHWQFVNVCALYPIAALSHGAEIYCRIEEKENGDLYTKEVHKRAANLQSGKKEQQLQTI